MNTITIIGRIAKKGELRDAKNGNKFLALTVASSQAKKTNFFSCTAFGQNAEFIDQYSNIGDTIYVSGFVNQKEEDHSSFFVNIERIEKFNAKKEQKQESVDIQTNNIPF